MNAIVADYKKYIGIDALLLAVYFALAPMHQTLVLPNGSTVTKYLAFAVMIACVFQGYIEQRRFYVIWDLIWPVGLMLGWFSLSILWSDSRSSTVSTLVTLVSYAALLLIAGSRRWNEKEKVLFLSAIILSCTVYAIQLIISSVTVRRATLVFAIGGNQAEADQNTVAFNLGFGALAGLAAFLQRDAGRIRYPALASMFIILAGIISTGSRGGTIGFSIGAAYLYFRKAAKDPGLRQIFFALPCILVLLLWLLFGLNYSGFNTALSRFQNITVSGRLEIWSEYFGTLFHRPAGFLSGYGAGCETQAHAAYMGRSWVRASHNDYISILCQVGIPGLILTVSLPLHIWKRSTSEGVILGCACIILALTASMDINYFKTYGWWNAMLMAYIGVDGSLLRKRRGTDQSVSGG